MQQAETRSTNLALLRVCSIILIVNGLNGMTGMFWNLFTTGECEGRLFFVFLPFVTVAVGVIAIARDSALILKIFALLFILMMVQQVMGAANIPKRTTVSPDPVYVAKVVVGLLLSFKMLFVVSVYLIDVGKKKLLDQDSSLNVGLLRFCSAFFIMRGVNEIFNVTVDMSIMELSNLEKVFSWIAITLGGISVVAGVLALATKKAIILKVYAFFAILQLLWDIVEYRPNGELVINTIFNVIFVVLYATFLIDPKKHTASPEVEKQSP